MRLSKAIRAIVAALLVGGPAAGGEIYYVTVFGSQLPTVNRAKYTHSFATFVRAVGPGDCGPWQPVECFTISWLPQTLDVRVYSLLPECGVNLDLHTTLRYVLGNGERVSRWGPYPVRYELYESARRQKAHLESGRVQYKAVDTGYPTDQVSNCIHALADVAVGTSRLRVLTPSWGEAASYFITLTYYPWLLDTTAAHEWVADYLGLAAYPIVRRDLDRSPTGPPGLRAAQTLVRWRLIQQAR